MMSSSTSTIDWQPVQECLAAARTVRKEFADTWAASIDELTDLRDYLEDWQQELSEEHAQIQQERAELEEAAKVRIDAKQGHKDELDASRIELVQLREQIAVFESQREEFDVSRDEVNQLCRENESQQIELNAEQKISADLRVELEALHEEMKNRATSKNDNEAIEQQGHADTKRALETQTEKSEDLRQQCEALETELELVRARAAEMSATLSQERHQMKESREEWANEIKQLRRYSEQHAVHEQTAEAVVPTSSTAEPARVTPEALSNIVVGSMLAQFGKIHQQRANRRKRSRLREE